MSHVTNEEPKIRIRCKCGKVLHVLKRYVGKRGRCPQCARLLVVRENDEHQDADRICPACGAYLSKHDQICVSCRTNVTTGEWNNIRHSLLTPKKIAHYTVLFYIIASVGFIAYLLIYQSCNQLHPDIRQFERIDNLPENDKQQIENKLSALREFYNQYSHKLLENCAARIQNLRQKRRRMQVVQRYRKLQRLLPGEQNPFQQWLQLKLLKKCFPDVRFPKSFNQYLDQLCGDMVQLLRAQAGELSQLIQERRFNEITTRSTPHLLKLIGQTWQVMEIPLEAQHAWDGLLFLYRKKVKPNQKIAKEHSSYDRVRLEHYRKQFTQYNNKFAKWIYEREYEFVQQLLENLWESLHTLENIAPAENLIIQLRTRLREVQTIKTLFSIAHEGAKQNMQETRIFILRDGTKVRGQIRHYALGYFHIENAMGKNIPIALKNLHTSEIVTFALSNKKDKYTYEYAGIFCFYEKSFLRAQKLLTLAIEYGADGSSLQKYLQKIRHQ